MKRLLLTAALLAATSTAFASPECTKEPKDKWMTQDAMKKKIDEQGYKVKKFKVTGNCYEIYGWNKEGKKAEVYFNPVDGSIVKQEIGG
ncbi:PepSY domain-containing protein [Chitinivorax sp. PXF-14]|uniref:PepSY domain-containing protein n=1 Tax=Chitinivorax sp. PXF-14 TaxID=3230488 RepID=UPI0034653A3A